MARVSWQPRVEEESSKTIAENGAIIGGVSIPKNGCRGKAIRIVVTFRIQIKKTAAVKGEFKKDVTGRRKK